MHAILPRPTRGILAAFVALLVGVFLAGPLSSTADAGKAEKKFKGKIMLSAKGFPAEFKSDSDMIKKVKKAADDEFVANKKGSWSFEYLAFFKTKANSKQLIITFYDITDGEHDPEEVYSEGLRPDDPRAKVMGGYMLLPADFFKAERRYRMEISPGRGEDALAKADFVLRE